MEIVAQTLPGLYLVGLKRFSDTRGEFVKTYMRSVYESVDANLEFREEFYSLSQKNVLRGMHFQVPPHDHVKMVYCAVGMVEDVVLDLRSGPYYGSYLSYRLSAKTPSALIIPKGMAHGFRSLTDNSLMIYKTSTEYAPDCDRGIRWDSFGYDWKLVDPILSARDRCHPSLADFITPF